MSEKPEKPLHEYVAWQSRLLSRSMVDIYVGPESTHWILHEKLLCYYSPFFASIFYDKSRKSSSTKAFGIPETEDSPFELFVGWLYSRALRYPDSESDIGPLLDLYLLSTRFEMEKLGDDVVETVRAWYHNNETYPGLRRVQYIYANTDEDNPMREMMVGSVARYLTLSERIPTHWEKALRKNGQLAVDIIRSIQEWHLEGRSVPDAREASMERGRGENKVGFSAPEVEDSQVNSSAQGDDMQELNGNGTAGENGEA
ncbi:hypothetical protein MMC19_001914 [Ptychographa xylographoides]|nr:hypothetical protein [Ptychographa xylographoides]